MRQCALPHAGSFAYTSAAVFVTLRMLALPYQIQYAAIIAGTGNVEQGKYHARFWVKFGNSGRHEAIQLSSVFARAMECRCPLACFSRLPLCEFVPSACHQDGVERLGKISGQGFLCQIICRRHWVSFGCKFDAPLVFIALRDCSTISGHAESQKASCLCA